MKTLVSTFRQNYRKVIGALKLDDRVYSSISENKLIEGIEHWLPLFFPRLQSVFSCFAGASLSYDKDFLSSINNKWEQIVEEEL